MATQSTTKKLKATAKLNHSAAIKGNFAIIRSSGKSLNELIHATAILILEHVQVHRNGTLAKDLCFAMPASMRRKMLVAWFEKYSPIKLNLDKNQVNLIPEAAKFYVPWDIQGGKAEPFYEMAENNPEQDANKQYSLDDLLKMIARTASQIEKKANDGKVKDSKSALDLVAQLQAIKGLPAPSEKAVLVKKPRNRKAAVDASLTLAQAASKAA